MARVTSVMMASSSSGGTASEDSSDVGSTSSNCSLSVHSVLDRLRSPQCSEISRKRSVKTNPPAGKRQCKGRCASDPKGVELRKRVQDFPNEMLKVSAGVLFREACREELGLKKSIVQNHIRSKKHEDSKKKREMKEAREKNIAVALAKHNEEQHLDPTRTTAGLSCQSGHCVS